MPAVKRKERRWIRCLSILVLFFFSVNTISMAYPRLPRYRDTGHGDLLQVQSMFDPLLDAAGKLYGTQIRLELSCMLSMATGDKPVPFQDINAEIDKWLCASEGAVRERVLDVISDPVKNGDGIELYIEILRGRSAGRRFRLVCSSRLFDDPASADTSLLIEEIPPEISPEGIARMGKWAFPAVRIDPPGLVALDTREEILGDIFPYKSDEFTLERLEQELMARAEDRPRYGDILRSFARQLSGFSPRTLVYDELHADLFGFSSHSLVPVPDPVTGFTMDMIALHSSVSSHPAARFHEVVGYLSRTGRVDLEMDGDILVVTAGEERHLVDVGSVMREMSAEDEVWARAVRWTLDGVHKTHYLARLLGRAVLGRRLDRSLTGIIRVELVKEQLSHVSPEFPDGWEERLSDFYRQYADLVARKRIDMDILHPSQVQYRRTCLSSRRVADLFYLYERYGFDIFRLLDTGRTSFNVRDGRGGTVTFTIERTPVTGVLDLYRNAGAGFSTKVRTGEPEDATSVTRFTGRAVQFNFLIKARELLSWAEGPDVVRTIDLTDDDAGDLAEYYHNTGFHLVKDERGRIYALKTLQGGLDAFFLLPRELTRLKGLPGSVLLLWSQREVDTFLGMVSRYPVRELNRASERFARFLDAAEGERFYTPAAAARFIIEDIEGRRGGALRDLGDGGSERIGGELLEYLERRSRAPDDPVRSLHIADEVVYAVLIEDTPEHSLPEGMYATHFVNSSDDLVIVLKRGLPKAVALEAVYHEWREFLWEDRLCTESLKIEAPRMKAHRLAAAEEVLMFGNAGLTPFHRMQLLEKWSGDTEKLAGLLMEDRKDHYELVKRYLGTEAVAKVHWYERELGKRLVRMVEALDAGKRSEDTGSKPVLTLPPDVKAKARNLISKMKKGQRSPGDVARSLLRSNRPEAVTMYLVSRLQNANKARDSRMSGALTAALLVVLTEERAGRKLLAKLFHSDVPGDAECARYLWTELGDKGIYHLMTAGTFDSHRLVRDRCLDMFAHLIENDIHFAGTALDVYARVRGTEEQEADFILGAVAAAGFTGRKNIEYYLGSSARGVLAGEVLRRTRDTGRQRDGRIGKNAGVSRIFRDRYGLSAQVVSSDDRNKVLAERMPLYPDDISAVKDVLRRLAAERPGIRELVRYYLILLERSPPEFHTFDQLYADLFGFVRPRESVLALHRDLSRDGAALFHELSEYYSATGAITMEYIRDRVVRVRGGDGRIIDIPISPYVRKRIIAEKERWAKGWKRSVHYLSRAVQMEHMGRDPSAAAHDKVLSEKIAGLRESAASDEAISGPFRDPSGNIYYTRYAEDPSVIDGVLDKWFSADEKRVWGRLKYDTVLENARYMNRPCSLVYLQGESGEILGVAISKKTVLPFMKGNRMTWLLEFAEVREEYRAKGLGSVMLAKVAETAIDDHCREYSVEIYDGEWDVIFPEWLEKHVLCVHPEEDSGYARTSKSGRQAVDFFAKSGFSCLPVIWLASPEIDEADKDVWMSLSEKRALSLVERVRQRMRSSVRSVPRQLSLFEEPSTVPDRATASGIEGESGEMGDGLVRSFLSGVSDSPLWKAFTSVSTVFHELGHIEWAYRDGQNPEYRLSDLFEGSVAGVTGRPAKYGGILGNAAGSLLGLVLYSVSFDLVSALAVADGGGLVNVIAVCSIAFITAWPLAMNLASAAAELVAFISGRGDLAGGTEASIPAAMSTREKPRKESGWMFRPLEGVEPMKGDELRDMYVLGDIHGELDGFRRYLEGLGLIRRGKDPNGLDDKWTGGTAILLQGGDVIDRGPKSLESLEYLRYLQDRAAEKGGKVVRLLGNHELCYLMRRAGGKWKGMVEQLKSDGDFRGFDEQLWKDDRDLVSMLKEDILKGRIQAAFTYGGKVFSHGFIDDDLIIKLHDETRQRVWYPEVFTRTANDILTASVKKNNYDSMLFSFTMGVIDEEVHGLFSKYFTDTVLDASGFDLSSGRMITPGRRARLATRKLRKGNAYMDKLPFDHVVFHDPTIFMLSGHISVFRGENSGRSAICADVGMTPEYGSGSAALVFRKGVPQEALPPERASGDLPGSGHGREKDLSSISGLDAMKQAFSDPGLLARGLTILREAAVGQDVDSPRDVERLNPGTTGFDICILPFLDRIPLFYGSISNDWGIHGITDEGIEYRCETSSEFIPFKADLADSISRVLKQSVDVYFSERIDALTRHMIVHPLYPVEPRPARKLLVRGGEMIDALSPGDAAKMERFLGASGEGARTGRELGLDIDRKSLTVLFGMLKELPDIYKYGTSRDKWFWVLREEGIEFVDTEVNARELVEFTDDTVILNTAAFKSVMSVLQNVSRVAANTLINELDLAALSMEERALTPYDRRRKKIEADNGVRLPLVYGHCAVHEAAGRREEIPPDEVITRRFPPKELVHLGTALSVMPGELNRRSGLRYYSYRPGTFRNFTVDPGPGTGDHGGSVGLASAAVSEWEDMESVIYSTAVRDVIDTLDRPRCKRLTWIKGALHEKARHMYLTFLGEDRRKAYSSLSWDMRSWTTMRTGRQKKKTGREPDEHFLFASNEGGNSSKGDFTDHFAAYILFGPQFRKEAEDAPVLADKYRFLRDNVFGGREYGAAGLDEAGTRDNDVKGREDVADGMGKFGMFIEMTSDMRRATALDILRDDRIEFLLEREGAVPMESLAGMVNDDRIVSGEHRDVLRGILDLFGGEPLELVSFRAMVNDLVGFPSPENGCIALHDYLKDDKAAVLHELGEYLIRSGKLKLVPVGNRINIYETGENGIRELGSVVLTRQDALRQLAKGDSPHYLLRALLREVLGDTDAALSARIKILKQEREQKGLDRTYELGGDNACGEITRDLGSEVVWITAGGWTYRLLLTEDCVRMTRYDKRDGEAVGRDHDLALDRFIVVGRDPDLARYGNGHTVRDPALSREHFAFRVSGRDGDVHTVTVRDLGSRNGTLVGLRLRERMTGEAYLVMDELRQGPFTLDAVMHDPKGLLDNTPAASQAPGPDDRIWDIPAFMDRTRDDGGGEDVEEQVGDTFRASMPLVKVVRKALGGDNAPGKKSIPVDIAVDLSLVPAEDLEKNMETWAYLILMCADMRDVNFRFELPAVRDEKSVPGGTAEDRRGAPSAEEAADELRRRLADLAWINDSAGDVESFFAERVNTPPRPDAVEIQIISSGHLEWMRGAGEDLDDTQYPVALEGHTRTADNTTVLRNFQAALSLGLMQAALAAASLRDRESREEADRELPGLKKKLLPRVRGLYSVLRDDVTITGDTLDNMVHPESAVRLNLAISLALPPVTRMLFLKLRQAHENLHMFLMSA